VNKDVIGIEKAPEPLLLVDLVNLEIGMVSLDPIST
jgi:hypothetical protein